MPRMPDSVPLFDKWHVVASALAVRLAGRSGHALLCTPLVLVDLSDDDGIGSGRFEPQMPRLDLVILGGGRSKDDPSIEQFSAVVVAIQVLAAGVFEDHEGVEVATDL